MIIDIIIILLAWAGMAAFIAYGFGVPLYLSIIITVLILFLYDIATRQEPEKDR